MVRGITKFYKNLKLSIKLTLLILVLVSLVATIITVFAIRTNESVLLEKSNENLTQLLNSQTNTVEAQLDKIGRASCRERVYALV